MKLSYAILFAGEPQLATLLHRLITHGCFGETELVILEDTARCVPEYQRGQIRTRLVDFGLNIRYERSEFKEPKNFAERRNELNRLCKGDWIFQLDPDEIPTVPLLEFVCNTLIADFPGKAEQVLPEAFAIARENVVSEMPPEYAQQQGWTVDYLGRVNWPDYQIRLYLNDPTIFWVKPVHETLCQVVSLSRVETTGKFLRHWKPFSRQKQQNEAYKRLTGQP